MFLLLQASALSSFPSSLLAKSALIKGKVKAPWGLEGGKNDQERNLGDDTQIPVAKSPPVRPKRQGFPSMIVLLADPLLSCRIVIFSLRQAPYTSLPSSKPSPTHLEEAIFVPGLLARNCYTSVCGVQMERKIQTKERIQSPALVVTVEKLKVEHT